MTEVGSTSQTQTDLVPRNLAVRVVGTLRQGSNCLEAVDLFSVGRAPVMRAAEILMSDIELGGGSAVRWLKGDYGSGKTNMFARLLAIAHRRRWIVSYVQISAKDGGCELHHFDQIYAAIVANCVTPEQVTSTSVLAQPGSINGWQVLLDAWVQSLRNQVGARQGGDIPSMRYREAVNIAVSQLRRTWGVQGSFSNALREYALAATDYDIDRRDLVLEWFMGSDVFKLGADVRRRLRESGILEVVKRNNAKSMLRQMTAFCRYRGYRGVLILLDEVENVLAQTLSRRRAAYTILRELIDNVDERHGMMNTVLWISGTPDVYDGAKGITEYEALASRVMLSTDRTGPNPAAVLLDLSAFPLTHSDYMDIAKRVAALHAVAIGGDSRPADRLMHDIDAVLGKGHHLPTPRTWVRQVVAVLDGDRADV